MAKKADVKNPVARSFRRSRRSVKPRTGLGKAFDNFGFSFPMRSEDRARRGHEKNMKSLGRSNTLGETHVFNRQSNWKTMLETLRVQKVRQAREEAKERRREMNIKRAAEVAKKVTALKETKEAVRARGLKAEELRTGRKTDAPKLHPYQKKAVAYMGEKSRGQMFVSGQTPIAISTPPAKGGGKTLFQQGQERRKLIADAAKKRGGGR